MADPNRKMEGYVEGHWDVKPGYYELVDTKTRQRRRGTKLKDLKTVAEEIVSAENMTQPA